MGEGEGRSPVSPLPAILSFTREWFWVISGFADPSGSAGVASQGAMGRWELPTAGRLSLRLRGVTGQWPSVKGPYGSTAGGSYFNEDQIFCNLEYWTNFLCFHF